MALIAISVSFRGDDIEEDISTITDNNATEGEQYVQEETTNKTGPSVSDNTTNENNSTEGEQCVQEETTNKIGPSVSDKTTNDNTETEKDKQPQVEIVIESGSSSSDNTTNGKRNRDSDSSWYEDFDLSDDSDEEDDRAWKRFLYNEVQRSSLDKHLNSEDRQSLMDVIRDKQNKLVILRWSQMRREPTITSTTLTRVKNELADLWLKYEELEMYNN